MPDIAEAAAVAPDEDGMKKWNPFSRPAADEGAVTEPPEPKSSAVVVRPLRPAVAARCFEQLSAAQIQQHRAGPPPPARLQPPPRALDPKAYPVSPPRVEGAVKRTYKVEPEPPVAAPPDVRPSRAG